MSGECSSWMYVLINVIYSLWLVFTMNTWNSVYMSTCMSILMCYIFLMYEMLWCMKAIGLLTSLCCLSCLRKVQFRMFGVCVCLSLVSCIIAMCILCLCIKCLWSYVCFNAIYVKLKNVYISKKSSKTDVTKNLFQT